MSSLRILGPAAYHLTSHGRITCQCGISPGNKVGRAMYDTHWKVRFQRPAGWKPLGRSRSHVVDVVVSARAIVKFEEKHSKYTIDIIDEIKTTNSRQELMPPTDKHRCNLYSTHFSARVTACATAMPYLKLIGPTTTFNTSDFRSMKPGCLTKIRLQ